MKVGKLFGCKINPISLIIVVLIIYFVPHARAETPALRGLGESATPESMAHPDKLGPSSPTENNQSSSLHQPKYNALDNIDKATRREILLKPTIQKTEIKQPFTLKGAVLYAEQNYPAILKTQAQIKAAKENITVQKLNEYLPDSLIQWQEIMASHNKLAQIIYGSPVFPGNPGPGFNKVSMEPLFFSGIGFNIDWAPLDFGLHKARIQLAKKQYDQTCVQSNVTILDVQIAAATAFLDLIEAIEQIKATQENIASFAQFKDVVDAQVKAELKPGADAALAAAQLANANNQLFRARLNYDVAKASLANTLGLAGIEFDIVDKGIASALGNAKIQHTTPIFEQIPILQATKLSILTALAQRHVLDKEYYPVFHFLGGIQTRGSGLNTKGGEQSANFFGLAPVIPNYQVAMIANWNFLDWFRLHAEKRVQDQRIIAQQQEYNLMLQNLISEDARSRARVRAALSIAENMPVQVAAAEQATRQAQARYGVGLSSIAQVAEANQILAQSRMQDAMAKVAVWRAMLAVASVHGDLKPFLTEADRVQQGM